MPQFFTNKKLIVLLVGIIFLVAIISFSLSNRSNPTMPERIIKDGVGFVQNLASKPVATVTSLFEDLDSLLATYDENKRLKAQLSDFAVTKAELAEVKTENERLAALIDKEDSLIKYDPINATVIARNPDQWEEKVIVNKGTKHGVEKNMAVMTADGLIGKVTVVTSHTAEVELLFSNNPNYRISSKIKGDKKDVFGLIEGYDEERGELLMKRIDSSLKVEKDQTVVSSGLGGIFPQGLLIGKVTEVSTDDYGLTKMAYIKPAADFALLDQVVIVKRETTAIDGVDGDNTNQDLTNPSEESESDAK
ncbi:cell shape-determining protein MreC [Lysinibacillus alkalisoli]|uniref:Cell shape-determining protein MreC n=1 Tax=Lysinibacillus alkalisoli TaxID=1911548 RepID=A0A917G7Z3_9BACI|nr:rod shape-determining protein MreC [Lysinibacillus alkalisoli]GGG27557.1 cell shape-determining protein MreC [Lysinibacillus alkalisoli]